MPLQLMMDVHVRVQVTEGLRRRGVDVLTAQDDGSRMLPDDELLDRAGALERVIFSQDEDMLAEATKRLRRSIPFPGVIYVHQNKLPDRRVIDDLELLAGIYDSDDMENRVQYLPIR